MKHPYVATKIILMLLEIVLSAVKMFLTKVNSKDKVI